jgi:hypothetical protein
MINYKNKTLVMMTVMMALMRIIDDDDNDDEQNILQKNNKKKSRLKETNIKYSQVMKVDNKNNNTKTRK